MIRDGQDVDVILRRRGAPILDHLTRAERVAAETYAATFEAVASGGAVMPRDSLSAGGGGGAAGGPSREGRQSRVVDQAAFLRRMGEPLKARPLLVFGKRKPVEVAPFTIWHWFTVDEAHVKTVLLRCGVKDGRGLAPATAAVLSEVRAMAAQVLDAMGTGENPFQR